MSALLEGPWSDRVPLLKKKALAVCDAAVMGNKRDDAVRSDDFLSWQHRKPDPGAT